MKAEITNTFKVLGHQEGKVEVYGFGVIDLDKISLQEATDLHKIGCPIFVKLSKDEKAEAKKIEKA